MLAEEIKQKIESKTDKQKELFKRVEEKIKSYATHSEFAIISLIDLNSWMSQLDLFEDSVLNPIWRINDQLIKVKNFLENEGFKTELCWSINCISLKIIWQ